MIFFFILVAELTILLRIAIMQSSLKKEIEKLEKTINEIKEARAVEAAVKETFGGEN